MRVVSTDLLNDKGYIYAIMHPDTFEIRYIGSAKSVYSRLQSHIYSGKRHQSRSNMEFYDWIKNILDEGKYPCAVIIDIVDIDVLTNIERKYINKYIAEFNLLNKRITACDNDYSMLKDLFEIQNKLKNEAHTN